MKPTYVTEDDSRYEFLSTRGDNQRFAARPESFVLARSTTDVVAAVQTAVDAGRPFAARSGGHCYENFVADGRIRNVVDLIGMTGVDWDPSRRAVAVGPGTRLADLYSTSYLRWGVAPPTGASAVVAVGGHLLGGGCGPSARRSGLCSDHLYAVEVVVVDADGRARAVVAERDDEDPALRELWWAHTGAGGGNFGIATRFWLRSAGVTGDDPRRALPQPSRTVLSTGRVFPRDGMTPEAFRALVRDYGLWHERNSAPDSPYAGLFAGLVLFSRGSLDAPEMSAMLMMQIDGHDARKLLAEFLAEITTGATGAVSFDLPVTERPWLTAMDGLARAQDGSGGRHKIKSAHLRRGYSNEQIEVLREHLDRPGCPERASVSLQSGGGAVNALLPGDTAAAQRDSVLRALYLATWSDLADDAECLGWMRSLYRDVHASTGGVPTPDDRHDGCHINFPDTDLADPAWNTSGIPWQHLYFKGNHPRLQAVAATWDPRGVFGHAQSVQPTQR